jgi:AsmA protein
MDKPLTGSGNLVSEGEALEFKTTLTNPADLIAERPAQLDLTLSGAPLSLHYEGSLALRDDVSAEGAISVNAPSLEVAARWFGVALSPEAGAGAFAFSTQLSAAGSGVRLSAIDLKAGSMTATGSVGVEHQAPRPHIVADLKVSGFNLGAFTGESGGTSVAPEVQRQPAAPAPSGPAEAPDSIEELLNRPGPQVKGFTQRSGWSQEPIELAALGWIDADARIAVSDTKLGQLHVDAADVSIGLKDRVLKVTLADVKLYQGSGHGLVTLDATGADAAFTADASMSGITARPLLNDTAQVDWLAGRANVDLKIAGRGASEAALIQSLNGTANVAINNGAVIGFDLDAAMRQLSEGTIPDFELSPSLKTDFSQLTGSFVITNGIAKNDNLKLASSRLTGSGAGTVDLPQRSLDYTVKPKLVASAAAEGEQEAAGFEVPVHIAGSWEKPDVTPDIQGALGNSKNLDAVKELGKSFKGKNAGEIVEDLFGKEEGKPSKAEKLLDKLFKQ